MSIRNTNNTNIWEEILPGESTTVMMVSCADGVNDNMIKCHKALEQLLAMLEHKKSNSASNYLQIKVAAVLKDLEKVKSGQSDETWRQKFVDLFQDLKSSIQVEHQTKVNEEDRRYKSIISVVAKVKENMGTRTKNKKLDTKIKDKILIYLTQIVGNQAKLIPKFEGNKHEEGLLRMMLAENSVTSTIEFTSVFRTFENKFRGAVIESNKVLFSFEESRKSEFQALYKELDNLSRIQEKYIIHIEEKVATKEMAKSSVATAKTAAKSIATDNPGRQALPVQLNDTIEYGLKAEKTSTANVTADDTIPTIVNDSDDDELQTDESTMFLATSVTQEITQIEKVLQRDSCIQVKSHFDSLFQSIRKVMLESNFADSVFCQGYLCDGIGVPNESHNFNIFVVMSTSKFIATHPSTMARYWLKDLLASTWLNPKDFSEKIINATEKTNVMQTSCDMKMCLSTGNFHDVIISNDVGYTVNILPAIKINSTVYIPSEQNTSIAPPYLWEKVFYHEERKFYETVNPILRDSMKIVRFILNGLGSFEHFPGNGLITIANHISNREKVHSGKNDDENLTFYVIEMLRDICKHLHWRWLPYWFEPSVNLLEHIDAVLCGRMHVNVVAITSQQSRFHEAIHSICNQV